MVRLQKSDRSNNTHNLTCTMSNGACVCVSITSHRVNGDTSERERMRTRTRGLSEVASADSGAVAAGFLAGRLKLPCLGSEQINHSEYLCDFGGRE